MVSGKASLVRAKPSVIQWALTQRTALGRGMESPSVRRARVNALSARAFIGSPWPRKRTGIREGIGEIMADDGAGPPAALAPGKDEG